MCQAGQWDLEGVRQVQHVCDCGEDQVLTTTWILILAL